MFECNVEGGEKGWGGGRCCPAKLQRSTPLGVQSPANKPPDSNSSIHKKSCHKTPANQDMSHTTLNKLDLLEVEGLSEDLSYNLATDPTQYNTHWFTKNQLCFSQVCCRSDLQ